ncbi:alpha-acetolactate decarboxylase [Hanstruepera neustonica]|uniref:Alpha-acetolactate decarboxylase n=1 Tax=Hanstruepera neustonica TaxID=1445657 RepID=A0A2K1E1A8_9FLAO|nr:acetolactate decarboxylase [Hanstruepera neustonica]PNQ74061.1 alpha-acetolactate decarboxylase [Hanstruepera neustonica]
MEIKKNKHPLFVGIVVLAFTTLACQSQKKESTTYPDIQVVGAMKHVMWKGELGSSIDLDTIMNKSNLYGLGPTSYLTGELMINNGVSYLSKVTSDSTMTVEKRYDVSAPFFVYSHVKEWHNIELPENIKTIQELETFVDQQTMDLKRPFTFKLVGQVSDAIIHVQNLPKGTKVSSPDEAHQGQTNYKLKNETVEIIGFFSTEHQGIFTHHDSFLHMHLVTKDEQKMGHLDALEIDNMTLFLPKK